MRASMLMIAAIALGASGCAKAGPARSAGFVPMEMMTKVEELPFHKTWRKVGVDWDQYTKVLIKDVNTQYLLDMNWWQKSIRRGKIEADAQRLARYTKQAFDEAIRDDPNRRFLVVETEDSETLIAEIALTEIVPSKVVLNALSYAPFGVGTGVKVFKTVVGAKSTVAFEARVRDGGTGEVVAMFADREAEQLDLIGIKGLKWYTHAHRIIDDWAEQFVQVANRDREIGEVVADTRPFTLKPW